ncbi:MAG: TonB-dependent receptor, partial [Bacteroidales bacterium]|nr:TonB-dependent receptor [Bacteroidales bacterium]
FNAISLAQMGAISGTIFDQSNNEPLIGATVVITGTTKGTITDFDGNYSIKGLDPGTYSVTMSFVSYETQVHESVEVKAGTESTLNATMEAATTKLNEVKVVSKANRESEAMLLVEQKKATVIKESIGAQQLSSMGVSDAASATTKISGVTQSEGTGDIYVRGLGDRYLSTTMNGLTIPPDDIDKKNINLNLFSTDVISNVSISKTYSVKNYGDLTSGNVDIGTKTLTKGKKLEISIDGGINTGVFADGVFGDFKSTQNSNNISYFGYYNNKYELEESITRQSWNTETGNTPLGHGFSIVAGKKFTLFKKELSVLATGAQSNSSEYRNGIYKKYRMNSLDKSFTGTETFRNKTNNTGLLNLSYEINDNHNISYNGLYVHKLTDELYELGRNKEGYIRDFEPNEQDGVFVRDQNTKTTLLLVNQLIGSHALGLRNEVKWGFGYNMVNADEPNRFRNEVSNNPGLDRWQFGRVSNFHIKKSNQEIKDRELNGYLVDDISIVSQEKKKLKLAVGANFRIKDRAFSSNFKGVEAEQLLVSVASLDNMDEALLDPNYYLPDSGLSINNSIPTDKFDARLSAYAGFVDLGFEINKISGSLGLRYEIDLLEADWDVGNFVGRTGERSNTYSNMLPALNIKYQLSDKNAVRFAASKTITLPEFKEISPFEYVTPEGDVIKGNEDLKLSENYNMDLKWEFYPTAKELVSVTGFYKKINDPINLALTRGSSGYFKFDNTGKQATAYGLELEARYGIVKPSESKKSSLYLTVNATKMWFSQDLLEQYQYNGITETGLEGASEFIANGSLDFSNNKKNKFGATLTINYSSDKIFALGAPETQLEKETLFNSEIVEKGFTTLDLVVSKKIVNRVTIKLKAKNLLDPEIKQTQYIKHPKEEPMTEVVRSYKKGINLGLGITIKLD